MTNKVIIRVIMMEIAIMTSIMTMKHDENEKNSKKLIQDKKINDYNNYNGNDNNNCTRRHDTTWLYRREESVG